MNVATGDERVYRQNRRRLLAIEATRHEDNAPLLLGSIDVPAP